MQVIKVGNAYQVRDERGHLEVTCSTQAEAVAWIGGFRTALGRSRSLARSAAQIVTAMSGTS